jgi:deoxyhypusine synthase
MASCGVRETIRFLCEHKMVDVVVSTAGGIEEDFIKCLAPTYIGSKYVCFCAFCSAVEGSEALYSSGCVVW